VREGGRKKKYEGVGEDRHVIAEDRKERR